MSKIKSAPTERLTYRPPEIAARTGFSKQFIYKLIADGKLPAKRIGKAIYVTHDDLVTFLAEADAA